MGEPSAVLPTISCVAPGGNDLPAGTASPRASTPCSNFFLAALTFAAGTRGNCAATLGVLAVAGFFVPAVLRFFAFLGAFPAPRAAGFAGGFLVALTGMISVRT